MKKFENNIFESTATIEYEDSGLKGILTNKGFLLLFQKTANAHSAYINFSFNDLIENDLSWIILNWRLQVFHRPIRESKVTIKTWISFYNHIYTLREYDMYDEKNNLCAIAESKFCLFDLTRGRIAKLPENIGTMYGTIDKKVFNNDDLPRLADPTTYPIFSDKYKVRRFDLDANMHVHNLNYLNFAYELLPENIFYGPEFNNIEIFFKHEIKLGQTIHSFLYNDPDHPNGYIICIKNEDETVTHSNIKLYN